MNNEEIIEKVATERNIKKSTKSLYKAIIKDYCNFQKLEFQELLNEALEEEDNNIPEKDRKLKQRLIDYRTYKLENSSTQTVKKYLECSKTLYRHFGVVIPQIPVVEYKKDYHVSFDDILTKEDIKKVLKSTDNKMEKAIILFMASCGAARNETLHLTVGKFIKATKDYHNGGDIYEVLQQLENQTNIVPLFELIRIKTDYHYYTCCTPEATTAIIKHLKQDSRKDLKENSPIFDINRNIFNKIFQRINKECDFGMVGYYNKFRSHMLRKFHATTINDKSLVDTLQGRTRDSVTEAYYKHDPNQIREKYKEIMHLVTICDKNNNEVVMEKSPEIVENISSPVSPEIMQPDNNLLSLIVMNLEQMNKNIEELKEEKDEKIEFVEPTNTATGEKFIYINTQGGYRIERKLNGKMRRFGNYQHIEQAIEAKKLIMKINWDWILWGKIYNLFRVPYKDVGEKYIYKQTNGKYFILKKVGSITEHFGTCDTLNEAIEERTKLIKCNWDWELIAEYG